MRPGRVNLRRGETRLHDILPQRGPGQRNEPGAAAELASALAWYARQNQAFAEELADWAAQARTGGVTQHIQAGRDAYGAGRDQTVTNYRFPGE
jgi:hypothetical protein